MVADACPVCVRNHPAGRVPGSASAWGAAYSDGQTGNGSSPGLASALVQAALPKRYLRLKTE